MMFFENLKRSKSAAAYRRKHPQPASGFEFRLQIGAHPVDEQQLDVIQGHFQRFEHFLYGHTVGHLDGPVLVADIPGDVARQRCI